ncbi:MULTISPECIES: hypothetical protein [unclassified Clostridium]|uniref:hypothetical protein n=1 Tax=unclassified Clostridium TaxID=2614128 RepID=UPI0025BF0CBE|nr:MULTISPECIES: hypothetical protein [unclassified Clostridium]
MKYARAMTNMPLDGVITTSQKSKMMKKYDKEEIRRYLENPSKHEAKLREVVDYLCTISPQFCRLIEYIPNMAIITPFIKQKMRLYSNGRKTASEKAKTDFNKMCDYAEKFDIKSTSIKILKEVFKYGIFYGVEVEGAYTTYIKKLNPNLCKIISEGEYGLGIAFDFSYFDNNEFVLKKSYPPVFEQLYKDYKNRTKTLPNLDVKWQPIPENLTLVVKYDTTNLDYSVPPYVNIFSALYDLEEYQSLNKAKVTAENYTLIGLKIPTLTKADKEDDYAISNDMIDATTMQLDDSLPEYMGYFTTATDIIPVKASTSGDNKIDNVSNAVKNVWNASGFAESIFGVDNNNSGTLDYSIKVDEQQLFPIYDQLEKHWDLKLKAKFKNKFKLKLLKTTWFNISDMIKDFLNSAQASIPVATVVPLLLGFEISDLEDLALMQTEIFDILNKWTPLQSSHTTANDGAGRPKKDAKDLTDSGEQTISNDSNNKR